ncbi:MAG: hypothetical protein IT361_05775 [Gemmatimonadaceae bacterium]|nr:hypothetical protein [Gemmatimonadaceae bacterium]
MHSRHATPTLALLATLGLEGAVPTVPQPACAPNGSAAYHGALERPLTGTGSYDYSGFRSFVESRTWLAEAGVSRVRRRGDCGPRCIYAGSRNRREDEPTSYALASNHPICDAGRISIPDLPANGVLIGRLRYDGERGTASAAGDASFNLTSRRPITTTRRLREHYVVVTPGKQLVDKSTYAIWRIVAIWDTTRSGRGEFAVVDSGLFRVCLPTHMTRSGEVLASFRSCAEVAELHALSRLTAVQQRVLPTFQGDSALRQASTFSLLVRGDSAALDALALVPDSVKFGRVPGDDAPEAEDDRPHGPFASATWRNPSVRRRLLAGRYGELHADAPLWYTCVNGCCTGEPW